MKFQQGWWDFCLDTWNIGDDSFDYGLEGKSPESRAYIQLLMNSNLSADYEGCCRCADWDAYLDTVLPCIMTHQAPYSHLLYNPRLDYVFYFHATDSIGMYFPELKDDIRPLLEKADAKYQVIRL